MSLNVRLQAAGYDIMYVRVAGAGHGNMDIGKEFGEWVTKTMVTRH